MAQSNSNVVPMPNGTAVIAASDGPLVQATLMYDEKTKQGVMTVTGDNIVGGVGILNVTPELAAAIDALIVEFNDTIGPEYA